MTLSDCCHTTLSRAEHRRRQVIQTARTLFVENGFHATGIAQIAKQSGVAVGQIYRDFSCKEDIVAEIVNTDCRAFMAAEALRAAIEQGNTESVRGWIQHFVAAKDDPDNGRLFAEIIAESGRNVRIAAIFSAINDEMSARMRSALAMLIPGERIAERREALGETILALAVSVLHRRLLRPELKVDPVVAVLSGIIDREIERLQAEAAG